MASEPTLTIVPSYEAMSRRAADVVAETVTHVPECAISAPTGGTPVRMYTDLIERVRRGGLDFSRTRVYCLDEYVGVGIDEPASLTGWLKRSFLDPVGIPPEHVHLIPASESDPTAAAARFEADLATRGGLDLVVLGIAPNGHIAYNEPGSPADSRTRLVELTPESITQAAGYFQGDVSIPSRAMTMGVGTILEARRIMLIVSGPDKPEILRRALREPMTAAVPASWLRLAGERLEVIADEAAASRLA